MGRGTARARVTNPVTTRTDVLSCRHDTRGGRAGGLRVFHASVGAGAVNVAVSVGAGAVDVALPVGRGVLGPVMGDEPGWLVRVPYLSVLDPSDRDRAD